MIRLGLPADDPLGVARLERLGQDAELLVVVAEPAVAAVHPPAGHLVAVALAVLRGNARPLADEIVGDRRLPAEGGRGLGVAAGAVARPVEHQRDLAAAERLVQILDQVAARARLARLVARDAVERRVRRDHESLDLHDREDDVARPRLLHRRGEPLGVELADALIPRRLAAQAMDPLAAILKPREVMDEHAVARLLEPVGIRPHGLTSCQAAWEDQRKGGEPSG